MTPPASPIVKSMKSGLSMLLEDDGGGSISLRKKSLLNSASKSIDQSESYPNEKVASFSESFFDYAPKPTNLYPAEEASHTEEVSDSSLFSNVEIYDVTGGGKPALDSFASDSSLSPAPPLLLSSPSQESHKTGLGIAELLQLLLEDIQKLEKDPAALLTQTTEEMDIMHGLAEMTPSSIVKALTVLPAEEDGTAMDDLPSFSMKTDLLGLGVKDFAILDKASAEALIHVKVEGSFQPEVLTRSQRAISQETGHNSSTHDSNESSYYIVTELVERPSSLTNPDTIQVFRTDSDESQLRKGELSAALQGVNRNQSNDNLASTDNSPTPLSQSQQSLLSHRGMRRRSLSASIMISYRFMGGKEDTNWRFIKKSMGSKPDPLLLQSSPLVLKQTKSDFIPIIQNKNQNPDENNSNNNNDINKQKTTTVPKKNDLKLSIFNSNNPPPRLMTSEIKVPTALSLTDTGLFRRHSERTYQEELLRKNRKDQSLNYYNKYSRNLSFSGDVMQTLNPHTSNAFMAQFSPSTHSSNPPSRVESPTSEMELYQPQPPPYKGSYHGNTSTIAMTTATTPTSSMRSKPIYSASATSITPFSSPTSSSKLRKEPLLPSPIVNRDSFSNKSSSQIVHSPATTTATTTTTTTATTEPNEPGLMKKQSSSVFNLFKLF